MQIKQFEKSIAWQKSFELNLKIYEETQNFPKEEQYGFVSQMRRAATSITSNIAEGLYKETRADFARYLAIAKGSAGELLTQIMLVEKIGYLQSEKAEEFIELAVEIIKILKSSIKTLNK